MGKFLSNYDYPTVRSVLSVYPSVEEIISVEGGWMIFDTVGEYKNWLSQQ